MKKISVLYSVILLSLICLFVFNSVKFDNLQILQNGTYLSYDELQEANNSNHFGRFVELSLSDEEVKTSEGDVFQNEIIVKLFGFIPIKRVAVNILPEEEVFVGGKQIGLSFESEGSIVISDKIVNLENGKTLCNKYFREGDVIQEINGKRVSCIEDIEQVLHENDSEVIEVKLIRENKEINKKIPILKDASKKYKLGVWVRDGISGIGTLTFVKKNNCFAALGHPVSYGTNENILPIKSGSIYDCTIVDIEKGDKNHPGELKGVFVEKYKKGDVSVNSKVGVFGYLDNFEGVVDGNQTALLGGRLSVRPGKAKLISYVSGVREEYDIEIVKVNKQKDLDDKSFVFRVKDKRLIELTGGIVQGMSGSPILQGGKIIGSVTHVFIADSTMGYGVFSDWMLQQMEC